MRLFSVDDFLTELQSDEFELKPTDEELQELWAEFMEQMTYAND